MQPPSNDFLSSIWKHISKIILETVRQSATTFFLLPIIVWAFVSLIVVERISSEPYHNAISLLSLSLFALFVWNWSVYYPGPKPTKHECDGIYYTVGIVSVVLFYFGSYNDRSKQLLDLKAEEVILEQRQVDKLIRLYEIALQNPHQVSLFFLKNAPAAIDALEDPEDSNGLRDWENLMNDLSNTVEPLKVLIASPRLKSIQLTQGEEPVTISYEGTSVDIAKFLDIIKVALTDTARGRSEVASLRGQIEQMNENIQQLRKESDLLDSRPDYLLRLGKVLRSYIWPYIAIILISLKLVAIPRHQIAKPTE